MWHLPKTHIGRFGSSKLKEKKMTFEANRPYTWEPPTDGAIGKRGFARKDGYEKASGTAVYAADISLSGMLYAKFLRSPYAQADIKSLDLSRAKALPGVVDIIKYDDPDIKDIKRSGSDPAPATYTIHGLPGTADQYNHPMGVIVIAESEELCDEALRQITIEWDEKPFVLEPEESVKTDAPTIWYNVEPFPRTAGGNLNRNDQEEHGDVEEGFKEADKVIEWRVKREENTVGGVEPQSCIAYYTPEGYLDLYIKSQPINSPTEMANLGMVDYVKVRTFVPYQGAWFGGISWLHWANLFIYVATATAKRVTGRPVKLIYDESNFYNLGDDFGVYDFKVGFKNDGTITAVEADMMGNRYPMEKLFNSTKIKNVLSKRVWPFVNRNNSCCFRDGSVQCTCIVEVITHVAAELNMDPTKIMEINNGCEGDDWETVKQYRIDNKYQNPETNSFEVVLKAGKEAFGWEEKWHAPGDKKLPNGKMHGVASMVVNSWHGFNNANSGARMTYTRGKAYLWGAFTDIGVNAATARCINVSAESGLKYEDVICHDHHFSELGTYTHSVPGGSFGTENNTVQMTLMSRDLKNQILLRAITPTPATDRSPEIPAAFPDKKVEDLDIKDSVVFEIANPSNKKTVAEVTGTTTISLTPTVPARAIPYKYLMARQAHFIEVEVDTDTGLVDIVKTVCVNDVGTCINREGVEAQQYGGAYMGLGKSMTEEIIHDPGTGVSLNANLIGYPVLSYNDIGPIETLTPETRSGNNAYGLTGVGESIGCTTTSLTGAAVFNATGKWVGHYPTTPVRVLKALGKA
jgi:CO/xanthine dehydrogenase Mo-binding subunit